MNVRVIQSSGRSNATARRNAQQTPRCSAPSRLTGVADCESGLDWSPTFLLVSAQMREIPTAALFIAKGRSEWLLGRMYRDPCRYN